MEIKIKIKGLNYSLSMFLYRKYKQSVKNNIRMIKEFYKAIDKTESELKNLKVSYQKLKNFNLNSRMKRRNNNWILKNDK